MKILKTIWKISGSAKFAIPLLGVFTLAMIVGTIVESRLGTHFATRAVYFTWWFFVIQGLMVLSLIVAVLDRLPVRKRLTGFYIVHAAIVLIIAGSVVTKIKGLDGELQLSPDEAAQLVRVNEDQIYVSTPQKEYQFSLPFTVGVQDSVKHLLDDGDLKIDLLRFYPYASVDKNWIEQKGYWATDWLLKNDDVVQKVELMFPPSAILSDEAQLGPMKVKLLSWSDFGGKTKAKESGLVTLHIKNQESPLQISQLPAKVRLEDGSFVSLKSVHVEKSSVRFIEVIYAGKVYKFFPKYSEFPMSDHLEVDKESPLRLFGSEATSGGKNQVLISRDPSGRIYIAFQVKGAWQIWPYSDHGVRLPWMNLRMTLLKQRVDQRAELIYEEGKAHKDSERNTMAALVRITKASGDSADSKEVWLSDATREDFTVSDMGVSGFIGKKLVRLPFALTLDRFKMETNPGTEEAASYESFVKVGDGNETAHIYMNHPLKKEGFTFYQASYFQDDQGQYHSVLSVNQDPGRWLKYLGSLVLIVGLLIHYLIVYRATAASKEV
ncbi:cytochrome c biogenesis protein ResB [Bdellovibrio sp.]|uniref:cytochrome c biogenesis protein ResB n=1 Tax=Bdellovibrio sp. TaxID=28201 RepID=UPI0039E49AB2